MMTTEIQVPAGWYPDPLAQTIGGHPTHRHWWEGAPWTDHVEALQPSEAPSSPEVATPAIDAVRAYAASQVAAPRAYTATTSAPIWLMATMPLTQALLIFYVFTNLPPESSAWTRGLTLIFPFILYAALAGHDTRLMALAGHLRTAPWVTALVVPPVNLAVRSARIGRSTGAVAWPVCVWLLSQAIVLAVWWWVDPQAVMGLVDLVF